MKKKILIIGTSTKAYSLAKYFSATCEVFVAPLSDMIKDFATCIDIRENSINELLDFVMENGIDLTVPVSEIALQANITEIFNSNNQPLFGPTVTSAKLAFDKAFAKKTLYKLRIPTPKFGIFEKQNMATDYIKNQITPFVIKTNEPNSATAFAAPKYSKNILDSLFVQKNQKVIIEDYSFGTPFGFYAVTDGYKAIPLGSTLLYKHSLEGDGGQLTAGMGACAPNYRLSIENEYYIMDNVIYPTLDFLEIEGCPYLGVIGVQGVICDNNKIQILGYQTFMQDCDCDAVLKTINADLFTIFESCTNATFSDEFDFIPQKELCATSLVLYCKTSEQQENVIEGLEYLDEETSIAFSNRVFKNKYLEYEAQNGIVAVITSTGRTTTSSTKRVYEEVENIKFKGLSYRKDICKPSNL